MKLNINNHYFTATASTLKYKGEYRSRKLSKKAFKTNSKGKN